MVACTNECLSAVRALLTWTACNDYKLDISGKDNDGHTAWSIAKKTKNSKIITMIEKNLYLTAVNNGELVTATISPSSTFRLDYIIKMTYSALPKNRYMTKRYMTKRVRRASDIKS